MNRLTIYLIILPLIVLMCSTDTKAQLGGTSNLFELPSIVLTDLDSNVHDLHAYTDSGYNVILFYPFEYCGFLCSEWSSEIGNPMWEAHGPEGDNTLRMIMIDLFETLSSSSTDEEVMEYAQEMGVEYPIVRLDSAIAGIEQPPFYPMFHYSCDNKSSTYLLGYDEISAKVFNDAFFNYCGDVSVVNSVTLADASSGQTPYICNTSQAYYAPQISVFHNAFLFSTDSTDSLEYLIDDSYEIKVYINGTYHETQDIDPSTDTAFSHKHFPILDPIPVENNDEVTLVCQYPSDNYAADDSVSVTISLEDNVPVSALTSLRVVTHNSVSFQIRNSDGEYLEIDTNQFVLEPDSCYSIQFDKARLYGAKLKNNNATLISYDDLDFFDKTPWFYFHVVQNNQGVNITEHTVNKVYSIDYLDVLGRKVSSDFSTLKSGIYIEVKRFENGNIESRQLLIDSN